MTTGFLNKVALITGSSSGIGAATAVKFATKGCCLALTGRNLPRLEETARKCIEAGCEKDMIFMRTGDVTDDKFLEKFTKETGDYFGRIDILVHSAGLIPHKVPGMTEIQRYDLTMNTNARAPYLLSLLCTPYLVKSKGCIINVSSVSSTAPIVNGAPYCISKAALDHIGRCLALELTPQGVRVNTINGGFAKTPLSRLPGLDDAGHEKVLDSFRQVLLMNRIADPAEFANVIVFLASDDASFITGANLSVDGGHALNRYWNRQVGQTVIDSAKPAAK